ncbi:hypothetical protein [Flavobacterium columnare]|uniref:Uncharacterized protein n=1 Tax=Flavobacterium columnare TaxID=996 RepID=A0AA94JPJ1_9FLAO|nr:hypothetical protein [Flavobacterium columnare]MCH4828250.1 hypothetical protein [Flavobacterium columnare]MCH4828920.1 hypothetical protein [Flavobacterium columnare]MCH4829817.1 hypothetical protein [Flavobacterium columnare]MCH4831682.1 hypothetical protein [Flavobacterium columnare]MCH4832805.1 hypothetical protein [Flavobacterium columnare]
MKTIISNAPEQNNVVQKGLLPHSKGYANSQADLIAERFSRIRYGSDSTSGWLTRPYQGSGQQVQKNQSLGFLKGLYLKLFQLINDLKCS